MSAIQLTIDAAVLVPTLDVFREYFDSKYPCTDDKNDGSDMPLPDQVRFATYQHLLIVYERAKGVYDDAHNELLAKASVIT